MAAALAAAGTGTWPRLVVQFAAVQATEIAVAADAVPDGDPTATTATTATAAGATRACPCGGRAIGRAIGRAVDAHPRVRRRNAATAADAIATGIDIAAATRFVNVTFTVSVTFTTADEAAVG